MKVEFEAASMDCPPISKVKVFAWLSVAAPAISNAPSAAQDRRSGLGAGGQA
jgi:hypothetical protein